jgi:hypothetical protein
MSEENYNKLASQLSKLEYALIHSTWEPTKDDVNAEFQRDRNKNPYNEPHKPKLRSYSEVVKDLKITHFKTLLTNGKDN